MCEPNNHKFKTTWDGLTSTSRAEGIPTIHSKHALSTYSIIIYCEKCGFVAHDANEGDKSINENRQKLLEQTHA